MMHSFGKGSRKDDRLYDFNIAGDRGNVCNMKTYTTPKALRDKGITSFAAAEMDFKTAPSIMESIKQMADRGIYGFTIPTEEYYDAVKWWHRQMRGWELEEDWIVPVLGTIYCVAEVIRMTMAEGEQMIVQPPVYYRYEQAATRQNRRTVYNRLKIIGGRYQMDFEDLEEKMKDPRSKLLVLCNAHNPIGRVWPEADLQRVAELSVKYNVVVLSDEIFGEMTFDKHRVTPYASIKEGRQNAITVTSLGKAFNFTGVNHAHAIIPDKNLRERFEQQKYADHYGSMGPFEYASVLGAYCEEGRQWFEEVREYIHQNGCYVEDFLKQNLPKAQMFPFEGTSVCWIDWSFLGMEGEALHDFFEREALFEVETGEVYGEDCSAMTRMNLSSPRQQIEGAMERVLTACKKIEHKLTECL